MVVAMERNLPCSHPRFLSQFSSLGLLQAHLLGQDAQFLQTNDHTNGWACSSVHLKSLFLSRHQPSCFQASWTTLEALPALLALLIALNHSAQVDIDQHWESGFNILLSPTHFELSCFYRHHSRSLKLFCPYKKTEFAYKKTSLASPRDYYIQVDFAPE